MYKYKINFDDSKWKKYLDRLDGRMAIIRKLILSRIGEKVIAEIKANKLRGQVLKRGSEDLADSITYKFVSLGTIEVGTNIVYAAIHEFGGEIRPKTAKYLRFKIGGKTIFTKLVRMPKRPYLIPTIEEYGKSGKMERLIELTLQEKIRELEVS